MKMVVELSVRGSFSARVSLPDHEGICRKPHGYRFVVEVALSRILEESHPWLRDLHEVEGVLQEVLAPLEGEDLNDHIPYPSLEGIALHIARRMKERFPELSRVRIEAPPRYRVELTLLPEPLLPQP